MQETRASNKVSPTPAASLSPGTERCQILTKKGFLRTKNLTSGVALLIHSAKFQLGVMLQLHLNREQIDSHSIVEDEAYSKSALAMLLAEFQALGVRKKELVVYAVGGSSVAGGPETSETTIRQQLWNYGMVPSACDLGGHYSRSIWMDVESGRVIVRSERIDQGRAAASPLSVAS